MATRFKANIWIDNVAHPGSLLIQNDQLYFIADSIELSQSQVKIFLKELISLEYENKNGLASVIKLNMSNNESLTFSVLDRSLVKYAIEEAVNDMDI